MTRKIEQWMMDAAWEISKATSGEVKDNWIAAIIASHAPSAPSEQCPGLLPSEAAAQTKTKPEVWQKAAELEEI